MRSILPVLIVLSPLALVAGCGHSPKPKEETTEFKYRHTRVEMWRQLCAEVRESWRIDSVDEKAGEIQTGWDVRLHAMNTFGRRSRLTVTLAGSDEEGYTVAATQETERNMNENNPLSVADAEWNPTEADGVQATGFLIKFHVRMSPPKTWKEGR